VTHGNLFNTGTITRFLIEEQRRFNTDAGLSSPTGSFTALVNDVRLACKRIATLIGKGSARSGERANSRSGLDLPLGTVSGAADVGVPVNLTALANEIFVRTNEWGGQLAGMLSRERDEPYGIPQAYPRGVYLLLFDPLDGSSNIDVNDAVGSIFSVLKCPDGVGDPRQADFLQPGSAQVCAGYAIYGPATMLVLSTGRGVNGFTLDREIGEFMLTHPNLRVPQATAELAINASNSRHWEPAVRRYVNECMAGQSGPRGTDFNMRWIASLVAETHRILMRGGLFMYPRDRKDPPGAARLRLLYEANPIGYLIEQAGGRASTGYGPLLDVLPQSLHGCTSLVFGARGEVERIERYHRDHNEFELDVPLFAARGLFTTHT
jgi:fructose-1,6-bisphosphatase I/sedoheptulose-1,7-bisphosphatase